MAGELEKGVSGAITNERCSTVVKIEERTTDMGGYETQQTLNPNLPDPPGGFGMFDFARAESRDRQLLYANDTRSGEFGPKGLPEFASGGAEFDTRRNNHMGPYHT